jgi:hypothetical protein
MTILLSLARFSSATTAIDMDYFWRQTAFILLLGDFLEPRLAASRASELGKVLSLPA